MLLPIRIGSTEKLGLLCKRLPQLDAGAGFKKIIIEGGAWVA